MLPASMAKWYLLSWRIDMAAAIWLEHVWLQPHQFTVACTYGCGHGVLTHTCGSSHGGVYTCGCRNRIQPLGEAWRVPMATATLHHSVWATLDWCGGAWRKPRIHICDEICIFTPFNDHASYGSSLSHFLRLIRITLFTAYHDHTLYGSS